MNYLSDHSCLRVSESSINAEREGLPSKSLEMVMLEADTITPPPKFRAPNVSQLSSLSHDSPKPKSGKYLLFLTMIINDILIFPGSHLRCDIVYLNKRLLCNT